MENMTTENTQTDQDCKTQHKHFNEFFCFRNVTKFQHTRVNVLVISFTPKLNHDTRCLPPKFCEDLPYWHSWKYDKRFCCRYQSRPDVRTDGRTDRLTRSA
jgi:hypothetical protein